MQLAVAARNAVYTSYPVTVISFIFLILKLLVRYRITQSLGWDDILVAASWVVSVPLAVSTHLQAKHGMGFPSSTIPPNDLIRQTYWYWISVWTFFFALGLSKMSICFQYLRIFVGKRTTLAIRIVLAFVILCTTEAVIVMIFQCVPVAAFWNPNIFQGRCIQHDAVYYFNASMNIFTDVAIIALPIPALNQLHARKTQKIGLVIAFGMGGAGCIISLVRITAVAGSIKSGDIGANNHSPSLWASIEVTVCIICVCLPSLRPLLGRLLGVMGIVSSHSDPSQPSNTRFSAAPGRSWVQGEGVTGRMGSQLTTKRSNFGEFEEVELRDSRNRRAIAVETTIEVLSTADSGRQSRRSEGDESDDALVPIEHRYNTQVTRGN